MLKSKKVNGVRLYSVQLGEDVIAVQESWTDRNPAFSPQASNTTLFVLPSTLVELVDLLKAIQRS
ncbi:MAG: hypothetical protein ACOY9Y_07180 [Bacillota bacterium]